MRGRRFWKRQFDIVMITNGMFAGQCSALKEENQALKNLLHIKVNQLIDVYDKIAELEKKIEALENQSA